ncbi:LytTR family DNA-binding domain-containing protein [Rurimicrobium arvi]|uniref:LytTR family DNA-binding domain-containing protein n=1 Tax=Rurimicrobium arvi TaxID=2049916 RepID=A0ABP8MV58_9BACT
MKNISCIAADDEPLALKLVETFIRQTPFMQLQKSCDSALEVMKLLPELKPELLFLDINMPNFSGMELAHLLARQQDPPRIIFTTAYEHFAIEGYKVQAVGYLLKPFDYNEFLAAATRARELITSDETPPAASLHDDFIFIKVEYQWIRVRHEDILYIESLKDYVRLHLAGNEAPLLSLTSLKALEERLPASRFLRIHRSFIVPLDKISSIGKHSLFIQKTEIPVGEQYRETFRNIVDKWIS